MESYYHFWGKLKEKEKRDKRQKDEPEILGPQEVDTRLHSCWSGQDRPEFRNSGFNTLLLIFVFYSACWWFIKLNYVKRKKTWCISLSIYQNKFGALQDFINLVPMESLSCSTQQSITCSFHVERTSVEGWRRCGDWGTRELRPLFGSHKSAVTPSTPPPGLSLLSWATVL